jgi:hypothetical protein
VAERRYEVRVRGYAFDAAYQDHYRSDVVSRIQAAFALDSAEGLADHHIITDA